MAIYRQCSYCKKRFRAAVDSRGRPSSRRTCSKECQIQYQIQNRAAWTDEQDEKLKELANCGPIRMVRDNFNVWARNHELPTRTMHSIHLRMLKLGLRCESLFDFITLATLARRLGIASATVNHWRDAGLKTTTQYSSKGRVYVNEAAIVDFAKKNPRRFGGIPYSRLFRVLGDEALVDHILRHYPTRPVATFKRRRVVCLQNNCVYSSMRVAAKAHHLSVSAVYKSCRQHKTLCGLDFRYYDKPTNDWNPRTAGRMPNIVFRDRRTNRSRQQVADAREDD